MFEQIMDGVRRASESSLQMQQEMLRGWSRLWSFSPPGGASTGMPGMPAMTGMPDFARGAQKRWLELGIEVLNRHREGLDQMYKAGIQLIEQAFHAGEAKSPEDYRRTVEDLWRKLFELQKSQAESQVRDFQTWYEKSATIVQEQARS
jgi:hypothetical protein